MEADNTHVPILLIPLGAIATLEPTDKYLNLIVKYSKRIKIILRSNKWLCQI